MERMFDRIMRIIKETEDFVEILQDPDYNGCVQREFSEKLSALGISFELEDNNFELQEYDKTVTNTVFKFTDGFGSVLIRWDWYFQSYYGTEIEDVYEVEKVEVTKYQYNRI